VNPHDWLDRELRRLPDPLPPASLLPRVMAAVQALERRPWYTRAWIQWPRPMQALSSAAAMAVLVAAWWLVFPAAQESLPDWFAKAGTLSRVLRDFVVVPAATYLAGIAVVLALICTAFWSAVGRLASGGAHS
jgi:hypothetical protein